ncbi:hypothetical protein WN48_03260 [Eufriesea mexicana]|uniref:Uncharacterized protein n=1 Tax=Eufriesea mexicana TaxID=516756 RepID=A0A310SPR9_9HYME|nr:hypothetical protein WN48_03260 [Eufriesea mexicana]
MLSAPEGAPAVVRAVSWCTVMHRSHPAPGDREDTGCHSIATITITETTRRSEHTPSVRASCYSPIFLLDAILRQSSLATVPVTLGPVGNRDV